MEEVPKPLTKQDLDKLFEECKDTWTNSPPKFFMFPSYEEMKNRRDMVYMFTYPVEPMEIYTLGMKHGLAILNAPWKDMTAKEMVAFDKMRQTLSSTPTRDWIGEAEKLAKGDKSE